MSVFQTVFETLLSLPLAASWCAVICLFHLGIAVLWVVANMDVVFTGTTGSERRPGVLTATSGQRLRLGLGAYLLTILVGGSLTLYVLSPGLASVEGLFLLPASYLSVWFIGGLLNGWRRAFEATALLRGSGLTCKLVPLV